MLFLRWHILRSYHFVAEKTCKCHTQRMERISWISRCGALGTPKSSLVSGNWPGEIFFLSPTHLHSRMCIRIYIFHLEKQTSKQKKNTKKAKETKEEKRISLENWLICGLRGKDFSRHPHFWKQVVFFLLAWCWIFKKKISWNQIS